MAYASEKDRRRAPGPQSAARDGREAARIPGEMPEREPARIPGEMPAREPLPEREPSPEEARDARPPAQAWPGPEDVPEAGVRITGARRPSARRPPASAPAEPPIRPAHPLPALRSHELDYDRYLQRSTDRFKIFSAEDRRRRGRNAALAVAVAAFVVIVVVWAIASQGT